MLAGRVALVTGSSSGIGLAIAEKLAQSGAAVCLNGIWAKDALTSAEEFAEQFSRKHRVPAIFDGADMTRRAEIERMIERASQKLGPVDILVNNAGVQHVASVQEFTPERWQWVLDINLTACFHTTQLVLPGMLARGWGRLVHIASVHGQVGSAHKAAYVAAKHGLMGFSKVVALENAGKGVTSNCVCPGWVLTPLVQAQIDARAKALHISADEAAALLLQEKQPSKQFAEPSDIGGVVHFLCSDAANQITGTHITVDGGWTAQ